MIRVNGREEQFAVQSVTELIERLGIEPRGIAVAIDGVVVRRSEWADTLVENESTIEIVTAAAGG